MGPVVSVDGAGMPEATLCRSKEAEATADSIDVRWDAVSRESWAAEDVDRCWNAPLCVQASLGEAFDVGLQLHKGSVGGPRMRREDLFSLAAELGETPSAGALVEFVVNVNAWGYGSAGYAVARTRTVVKDKGDRGDFVESAGRALAILRAAGPVPAYYFLHNQSAGHVPGWGPAFFTKFLYFADPTNQPAGPGGALILDQIMDGQVRRLVGDPANQPGLGRFRTGAWTTPEYAFYLGLMHRVGFHPQVQQRPDRVEAVLFHRGQDGKQQRRATKECGTDG